LRLVTPGEKSEVKAEWGPSHCERSEAISNFRGPQCNWK
jgi:hypothetical protein